MYDHYGKTRPNSDTKQGNVTVAAKFHNCEHTGPGDHRDDK